MDNSGKKKSMPAKGYEVQMRLFNGSWENCVSEDDGDVSRPLVFATRAAAEEDLFDHLKSLANAGMEYNPEEYRVQEVNKVPNA